jgi:hypothetical protein
MSTIITHLIINYIWIDDESITVGATDNERWQWEHEDGYSGADAFSFVQASIVKNGKGYAPTETVTFLLRPGTGPHRELAERVIGQLCAIAWEIKERSLELSTARELFFGRELRAKQP